jgi:hypothetical protein
MPLREELLKLAHENPELRTLEEAWGKLAYPNVTLPREFYLRPEIRDTKPLTFDGTDVVAYKWEQEIRGRVMYNLLAFVAKQNKPAINAYYMNAASRDRELDELVEGRRSYLQRKQEEAQKKKEFQHGVNVGDIFYTSWGYDQTNVDFYQVTKVMGKAVEIRKIQGKVDHGDAFSQYVVALPNHFIGGEPPLKKIPQMQGNSVSIKIESYAWAHPWDGKPKYESGPHGGH